MDMPTKAGWYDDPENDQQLRYFDGVVWSKHTTPRSTRPSSAAAQPGQQQFPGQGHAPQYPGQVQAQPPQQASGYAAPPAPGAGSPPPGPHASPPGVPTAPGAPQQGGWQQPGQQYPGQHYQGQNQQFPGTPQGGWNAPSHPGMQPVATTPDGQPLASFWQRVGAFVLDWLIQSAIAGILGSFFLLKAFADYFDQFSSMMSTVEDGGQPDFTAVMDSIDSTQLLYFSATAIAVFVAYQYLFLTRTGQTPGKMATGISVRLRERPGVPSGPVVLRRLALPVALFLLQMVPVIGSIAQLARLLDLVWPSWDGRKQALHDKVAQTNVVVGKQPRS
jgi:uncharacterized RDD family membrane protein YckC